MRRIKLIIAYDGTDFSGWQVQPCDVTIAGVLEKTFHRVFGENVSILGASRTDAGVHALGQVAVFKTTVPVDLDRMKYAWNAILPSSLHIRSLELAEDGFHPFHNVDFKIYYYHFFLGRPLPIVARFGWNYRYIDQVDFGRLGRCLALFEGTHDFGSFCTVETGLPDETIRTIYSVKLNLFRRWGVGQIAVIGKAFARFQVRRMVGAAFDVARRPGWTEQTIAHMLANPNPRQELIKADGKGLCLRKIVYRPRDL